MPVLLHIHIASQSHDFMLYLQYGSSQLAKATAEGENKLRISIYYSHCPDVALPLCEYFVSLLSQIGPKRRF